MAISPRYARKKGREFELEIAKSIRDSGLDKDARRTPLSGAAAGFPSDVWVNLPISLECKRHETTAFQKWYRQAESDANKTKIPIVVWRASLGQSFAYLSWNDLLSIMTYAVQGGWTDRLPI